MIRDVLARQVLFTGFEAVRLIAWIALLVGVAIVVQAQLWLNRVGQSELLGPILVAVVVRELGPLLTNFVVIGRSGAAIASELATMKVNGEIRVVEAQGIDPFRYLVLPRVAGAAVSVFCLTVVFIAASFVSGFAVGVLTGANTGAPGVFLDSVLRAVDRRDVFSLFAKTLVPGALTGAICCLEGMGVRGALTEIPQATTRGLVRSVAALFVVSVLISVLTYL